MNALQSVVDSLKLQRVLLNGLLLELEDSAHTAMAGAMFDVIAREVQILVNNINEPLWPLTVPCSEMSIDEKNLEPVLGKPFLRRLHAVRDLSSSLVEQLCTAADEITNDALAQQSLPLLKSKSFFPKPEEPKEPERKARKENKVLMAAHAREYMGTSLREYACALESQLESLQNLLTGAALLSVSQQMSAEPSKGSSTES